MVDQMGALLVLGLMTAATQADATIAVGERPDRAVMLVITSRAAAPNIPSSAHLDAAQRVFGRETSLNLASAEQAGVDASAMRECPVDLRLRCWSKLARPDARPVARYLLVLTLQPVGGNDRTTLLLLDLDRVQGILSDDGTTEDVEAQEQRIFELAVQLEPVVLSPDEEGAAERFMEDAVMRELRPVLESSGHFRPHGRVELHSNTKDLAIELDGRVVGTTSDSRTTLTELLPGERTLSLRRGDGWMTTTRVRVQRGEITRVEMEDPPSASHPARPFVWVGGLVVAAVGVTVLGITAASSADGLAAACLQRGVTDACPSPGILSSSYDGVDAAPTADPNAVNPSGLLLAPLGIGLATGGLATGLGTLLFGDEGDFPWPQLLVGLGAVGLAYGLGAAFDAR